MKFSSDFVYGILDVKAEGTMDELAIPAVTKALKVGLAMTGSWVLVLILF